MKKCRLLLWIAAANLLPLYSMAQTSGLASNIDGLHGVLDRLYNEMIPLCSSLIGVGRGIAGFAALWYIAVRVWRHLTNAESIDFYPLFRPFVIGFAILIFPAVIGLLNGVMQPTVTATSSMVTNSDQAIAALLKQKEEAVKQTDVYEMYVGENGSGDRDRWYKYTHPGEDPSSEGLFEGIGNDIKFAMAKASYNFRNSIKEWMSEVLQVLFSAASLCINTIRTFNLIILAILGPLSFGLSVFDGFHHALRHWLARYINIFLWLPIANLFGAVIGKIQENMLSLDLSQIASQGDTFFSSTDMGYLIFMIIGIIGYFTVPSIANNVLWVGGGEALTGKATGMAMAAGDMGMTAVTAAATGAINGAGAIENWSKDKTSDGKSGNFYENAGYGVGKAGDYLYDKLRGDKTGGQVS
ncbi:MAG: conjugative transposon protein TraJ [Sphingobacteriia bacterium]|nr:conjugative transposon protein TraJ [Sphingobacteriia bacterium]